MGAVGLKKYAESMGIPMTEEVAQSATNTYRSTHPEVCKAWRSLESQLTLAVKYPGTRFGGQGQIVFDPPFLRWRLPSGRELFYFQPEVDEDGRLSYMGQNQYTNKWERLETWGGKLCVSGETLVLTNNGWKPLRRVSRADRVYDGVDYVQHGGILFNGIQDCVTVDGVKMTPDHEVYTHDGWKEASQLQEPYRAAIRYVDSDSAFRHRWEKMAMGVPVRLWGALRKRPEGYKEKRESGACIKLRMQDEAVYRGEEHEAWNVSASCLLGLEVYGRSMLSSFSSGVSQLWGSGYIRLREMAGRFRQFLGRFRIGVGSGAKPGKNKQQRELRARKCEMDSSQRPVSQPTEKPRGRHTSAISHDRGTSVDPVLPMAPQAVYDICNAGPRQRFVVLGESGPFLVHNCENGVQAIARDVLVEGLRRYHKAGGTIVGHVHDEIIAEENEWEAEGWLRTLITCMSLPVDWAPGLMLGAAGYVSQRYRKD
jgi:hypothetical protein